MSADLMTNSSVPFSSFPEGVAKRCGQTLTGDQNGVLRCFAGPSHGGYHWAFDGFDWWRWYSETFESEVPTP